MKIKHWDKKLNKWVTSGASNASSLELTNPAFTDEDGIPITIDRGFSKIAHNLSRIEDNLAWIYLNGAHGGGGGGTGPGGEAIRIELPEDTIYTSTGDVEFQMLINSGSVARMFTIEFKDLSTGKIIHRDSGRSLRYLDITLPNIEESTVIEITAVDNSYNQAIPARLPIIVGAVSMTISETPKRTIDLFSPYQFNLTFYIKNEIAGAETSFIMEVDGVVKEERTDLYGSDPSVTYSMLEFLKDPKYELNPSPGKKYNFRVYAKTKLDGVEIISNVITYQLSVVDSSKLTIVTSNISTNKEEPTLVTQGTDIKIDYYLSYSKTTYDTFEVVYKMYLVKADGETLVRQGQTTSLKSTDRIIFIGTIDQPPTKEDEYIRVDIEAWAEYGEFDVEARDSTSVYAAIGINLDEDLTVNNDNHGLLAYYSSMRWTPLSDNTNWRYFWDSNPESLFYYNHAPFLNSSRDGVNLKLNKTNGNTTGFINAGTVANPINGIVLNGESYANLEIGDYMFPDTTELRETFFQQTGFNFSITYRAKNVPDVSKTVMSIGKYTNDVLRSGIEVTLDKASLKIEYVDAIEVKLPLGELITLDFDVSYTGAGWFFKIYLNGVLSAVTRVEKGESINWTFGEDLYFGCRNDKGTLSRFSDVSFYDIKVYTKSQPEVAIVQNYISATEQATLLGGKVNPVLSKSLQTKNFFSNGRCIIWDYVGIYLDRTPGYLRGRELYNTLIGQLDPDETREIRTPYPVILIKENSLVSTDFKKLSTAVFPETDKEKIMERRFNCTIEYVSEEGKETITTADGVPNSLGVKVGLQGTSSLSYSSKNYEIYLGEMADGRPQLFTPKDDWLPENQFTLKADVMDSAHVNNVVIGKIINGEVKDDEGTPIVPMNATPPMTLSNSYFNDPAGIGSNKQADEIKGKMKHTSDGFPSLLFIEYAPEDGEVQGEMKFMGIYNFNLGRHAYHNLGLELLQEYEKRDGKDGPAVIESYRSDSTFLNSKETETVDWKGGKTGGVYSLEVSQNNSTFGAFQQGDMSIVEYMVDTIYSSRTGSNIAITAAQVFFEQMAIRTKKGIEIPAMRLDGNNVLRPKEGTKPYVYVEADYTFIETEKFLHWENAVNYYLLILIFGMVDSTVKNLSLRTWGGEWYPAFYDMDTAFGIDNAGQDTVEYWAHLHYWRNVTSDDGLTSTIEDKFYPHDNSLGLEQHYAAYWNRIWEIIETLPGYDSDAVDRTRTMEARYVALRKTLFKDPEKFIEDHYKSYTEATGSIIFNYDYKIKYLEEKKRFNEQTQKFEGTTDFSQLAFLHGNRVVHVKDWFLKRMYFLDGVYGFNAADSPDFTYEEAPSPINTVWIDNRATGSSTEHLVTVNLEAPSKMLFQWSHGDNNKGSFWIDERPTEGVVTQVGGFNVVSFYANKFITKFHNFKGFNWSALRTIDFPSLRELDLSNLINVNVDGNFLAEVANRAKNEGLVNLEKLILKGIKFRTEDKNRDYQMDLSQCHYLNYIDASNSDFTSFELPETASLKYYNLSYTTIPSLDLRNQSFLEDLILTGCENLTDITLTNCNSLKNLSLPPNVETIKFVNCPLLEDINITYTSINGSISGLKYISVSGCDNLRTFNIEGQNNNLLEVNLVGAPNLEYLNFSRTNTDNIRLPNLKGERGFNTLKTLDISYTDIKNFTYNDDLPTVDKERLDLTNFPDLYRIRAAYNKTIAYIDCVNNEDNAIRLESNAFFECSNLKELNGHFSIEGQEVFKGCSTFTLNDPKYYVDSVPTMFLKGPERTNIKINTYSLRGTFFSCYALTFDDFLRIQAQFNNSINSLEDAFKGCRGIRGDVRRDFFAKCRNVEVIKGAFDGTGLSGAIVSRSDNFSLDDESTWGTFDYIPKLTDAEGAFRGSLISWVDNNLFQPVGEMEYKVRNINKLFSDCYQLRSAEDTRVDLGNIVPGVLNSETFFTGLNFLTNVYPEDVFEATWDVRMEIVNREVDGIEHTFLYHTKNNRVQAVLDHSLYNGVKLVGEIKENVFGGVQNEFIDGKYYIPKFRSIINPFLNTGNEISVNLGNMGNIFSNLRDNLLRAEKIFSGLNCIEDTFVPVSIFKGCKSLNSIKGIFSNLNTTNKNVVYEFPQKEMFEDTVSLEDISNIFSGTNKMKIKLLGEGFRNCVLTDVSGAFASSGIFGIIPYRLFFMEKTYLEDGVTKKVLNRTIEKMEGLFNSCWLLGYDSKRTIDIGSVVENFEDEHGIYTRFTTWEDNVVSVEGTPVNYSLDKLNLSKVYNYRVSDVETIPNPEYDISKVDKMIPNPAYDEEFNPGVPKEIENPDYVEGIQEIIPNPDYDPDQYHFDSWYLDGNTWDGATLADPSDLDNFNAQKARLERKYFVHDRKQMQSIIDARNSFDLIIETSQNYKVPTDLFRYCGTKCTLSGVLDSLNWNKKRILIDNETGRGDVVDVEGPVVEGLKGRIPAKLFNDLRSHETFEFVFENTKFDPYYNVRGKDATDISRGTMYPLDLFTHNTELRNIPGMFRNTVIPSGIDIDPKLFTNVITLSNISSLWEGVHFSDKLFEFADPGVAGDFDWPQISFKEIFRNNVNITNASGLFAVYDPKVKTNGIRKIDDSLLRTARFISNVSNMFYYNNNLDGSVPKFEASVYQRLSSVDGYLTGVNKGQVKNADSINPVLMPIAWREGT